MAEPEKLPVEVTDAVQTVETIAQTTTVVAEKPEGEAQEEEKISNQPPPKPKVSLCTKYGIMHPFCHSRTEFCQHDFGCFENIVKGTLRSFGIGYGIKTGLSLIGLLIGFKKLMKK